MSCNSAIYTANTTPQVLLANSQIPFGSVIRRFGRNLQLDGYAIAMCGPGYYEVDCTVNVEPTAIGEVSAALYMNGVQVPGAIDTGYAAAAGNPVGLHICCLVRQTDCNSASAIQIRLGEEGATVTNMACVVKKV